MYIIDKDSNKLIKVEKKTFKSLGLDERHNLQEWIAKEPSSLGEDLLIIQKEFDGFADTKERLDLLAIDKSGNLVIIENKLDDSGRDVTWQAIKYASYCSSLSKSDVVEIYQKYLNDQCLKESAAENLSDFFDNRDLKDVDINVGNGQRIFFVAANFRKEVTSSVMWLLNSGLKMKCFKVTPYEYNGKVLLDFDQIIPVKDAEDYTISIAKKTQDENKSGEEKHARFTVRQTFWTEFIDYNKSVNGLFAINTPTTDNWIGRAVKGSNGLNCNVIVNFDNCRAEIYIYTGDKDRNKSIFDFLYENKDAIEIKFGEPLTWQRLDDKVTSRIRIDRDLKYIEQDQRQQVIEFLTTASGKLMEIFTPYSLKYSKKLLLSAKS